MKLSDGNVVSIQLSVMDAIDPSIQRPKRRINAFVSVQLPNSHRLLVDRKAKQVPVAWALLPVRELSLNFRGRVGWSEEVWNRTVGWLQGTKFNVLGSLQISRRTMLNSFTEVAKSAPIEAWNAEPLRFGFQRSDCGCNRV